MWLLSQESGKMRKADDLRRQSAVRDRPEAVKWKLSTKPTLLLLLGTAVKAYITLCTLIMAGPTCSILHSVSLAVTGLVNELIGLVAVHRDGDSFDVKDTRPISGSYRGEGRPFLLFKELIDEEESGEIERVLEWTSVNQIGFAAMCNRAEDHRILAEMALWLAERLSGYVDLGGELPFPPMLPGKIFSVSYVTASGLQGQYMIIDVTALRAWMSCPEFRMVK